MTVKEIIHNGCVIQLVSGVRLRPEYFGGLAYDTRNGNTIEVDKNAFQFLDLIKGNPQKVSNAINFLFRKGAIKRYNKSLEGTLQELFDLKIIEVIDGVPSSQDFTAQILKGIEYKPWLSAPETVHWAVTYRCDRNCPDCYTARFSFIKNELNSNEALKLIDKIADWGVFQLAIGGGEPFARKDLPQLVHHAAKRGLSVHITTGKSNIAPEILKSVLPFVKNLQIGIRNNDLLNTDFEKYIQQLQNLYIYAQRLNLQPGANLILTKTAIERLENIITILTSIGFNRVIFLRYKPPKNIERWKTENPDSYQMEGLHNEIDKISKKNPHLNIRVDCALSFVQRRLPKMLTTQYGIKGCVAADRILALAPDGSTYPCSQLVHLNCYAGNLLKGEPQTLWNEAKVLRRYRFFRMKKTFTDSWCGICLAKDSCGGCRIFAMDGQGGDPGCPQPSLPPLTQMGKIGRRLDLADYLRSRLVISVGEYMERYGVGQRRAIKELNVCPQATSTTGKSARKKKDTYQYVEDDIIRDIQDSVGYTSGGFPFASYEQIAQWIEDSTCTENYPQWIKGGHNNNGDVNHEDTKYTQRVSGRSQFDFL